MNAYLEAPIPADSAFSLSEFPVPESWPLTGRFQPRAGVLGFSACLPASVRTSADVEERIANASPNYAVRRGVIQSLTGVAERRAVEEGVHGSDLAAEAGRRACLKAGVTLDAVDQVLYASASQDLIEPATANILQEKLGTKAPVFDVKNACNSFLNGLEVAEALVASGTRKCVLVTAGEVASNTINWVVRNDAEFKRSLPGYTMGDAGAAAVVVPSENGKGIFFRSFSTLSKYWPLVTLTGGGSMHPHSAEHTYLQGDGAALRAAFLEEGPAILGRAFRESGRRPSDFARVFVHQASLPYLRDFARGSGTDFTRIEITVDRHGNMAAASLPVALSHAVERRAVGPGDDVLLIGLASGISIGIMMIRL